MARVLGVGILPGAVLFLVGLALSVLLVQQSASNALEWDGRSLYLRALGRRRLVTQRGAGGVVRVPALPGSGRTEPQQQWLDGTGEVRALLPEDDWPVGELDRLRLEMGLPTRDLTLAEFQAGHGLLTTGNAVPGRMLSRRTFVALRVAVVVAAFVSVFVLLR